MHENYEKIFGVPISYVVKATKNLLGARANS